MSLVEPASQTGQESQGSRASQRLKAELQQKLQYRAEQNLLRQVLQRCGPCQPDSLFGDGQKRVNFCSNDYLGLASHPDVILAMQVAAEQYGVGSGASHLVTGHCRVHDELAEALADFCGRQKAMLFSTGYMANVGARRFFRMRSITLHCLMEDG